MQDQQLMGLVIQRWVAGFFSGVGTLLVVGQIGLKRQMTWFLA
jgi:hypothetical protein